MREDEPRQAGFVVLTFLQDRVPVDHPLRAIRAMVDAALDEMSPALDALYAHRGRPPIGPEVRSLLGPPRCRHVYSQNDDPP